MGLAASAASAILVKAEISNLELETQQIQRQKLNLANMSAAIEEKALQMDVPTAPSTYDPKFLKTVYESADGKVRATMGEDGKLHAKTLQQDVPTLEAPADSDKIGAQGVQVAAEVPAAEVPSKQSGNKITASFPKLVATEGWGNGKEFKTEVQYQALKNAVDVLASGVRDAGATTDKAPVQNDFPDKPAFDAAYQEWEDGGRTGTQPNQANYMDVAAFQKAQTAYNNWKEKSDELKAYSQATKYEISETEIDTADSTDGSAIAANYAHGCGYPEGAPQAISYDYEYLGQHYEGKSAANVIESSNGYSNSQVESIIKDYCKDASGAKLSKSDFPNGRLPKLYKEMANEQINGQDAYTVNEAKSKFGSAADDIISRINVYIDNNDGQDIKDWRITGNREQGFTAYRLERNDKGEVTGATRFGETQASSAYVEKEGATVSAIDATGVGTVTIPDGNGGTITVAVTETKKLDEAAYDRAQAEYNQAKAEYDMEQEKFNQETKKIQRVDKQFDMKLERLANERAALEKQLEDLDKVKEDNTEKSFSAFS